MMRTIRYEYFTPECNYVVRTVKVPLIATHADVESAIFKQLSDELQINWRDVEE